MQKLTITTVLCGWARVGNDPHNKELAEKCCSKQVSHVAELNSSHAQRTGLLAELLAERARCKALEVLI